jgi:hypothetical protein
METVITRDTDILREYLAALDARERGLSPFARLAATVKLASLRRELDSAQLEATDEDVAALRREIAERLERSAARRFESKRWGARISIFLLLVLGQQLALAIVWLMTKLFVGFASVPKGWNPVLPYEQPLALFVFIFTFFFVTPMLALLVLFGGRYFRSWRRTLPTSLAILLLSLLATYLVVRDKEKNNPVRHKTSLEQIADAKGVNVRNYREWVDRNWLLKDEKFQRDYEEYLRRGPGRWITSRFNASDDAAWRGAGTVISDYLEMGQDPQGFREWLAYYLDRNRIYSETRINEEVERIAGGANQQYLGLWQTEPYLKERDQRLYRAYLGSINASMKTWGIIFLAFFALVFLMIYLTGPVLSFWERTVAGNRPRRSPPQEYGQEAVPQPGVARRLRDSYYSFPERNEISTPSFFDTPLRVLARVHRSFLRLAVFTAIFVFGFWALVYALDLSAGRENAPSQVALMRSYLLFGGPADERESDGSAASQANAASLQTSSTYATTVGPMTGAADEREGELARATGERKDNLMRSHLLGVERQVEENDYQNSKRFEQQYESIQTNRSDIESLRGVTAQIQQATSSLLPDQINQLGSRVEERTGQVRGEASAARAKAESVERQLSAKLQEVENSAKGASSQAGSAEEKARTAQTRTEELREGVYTDINELKERTSKLGERMTTVEDRQQTVNRLEQLQGITFAAIMTNLKGDIENLDRRVNSSFYRLFNKGEATRDVEALRQRITKLKGELGDVNTPETKQMAEQLDELNKQLDQIAARIK